MCQGEVECEDSSNSVYESKVAVREGEGERKRGVTGENVDQRSKRDGEWRRRGAMEAVLYAYSAPGLLLRH